MLSVPVLPFVAPAASLLPTRRSCLPLPLVPVPVPSPRSRTKSLPLLFAALHTPVLVPAVLPASARLSGPASRSPSTATSPEIQTPTAPCIPAIVLAILFATPLRSASHPLLPTPHTPPAASVLLLPAPPPPLPALLPAPAALLRSLLARSGIPVSSPAHRMYTSPATPTGTGCKSRSNTYICVFAIGRAIGTFTPGSTSFRQSRTATSIVASVGPYRLVTPTPARFAIMFASSLDRTSPPTKIRTKLSNLPMFSSCASACSNEGTT